MVEEGCTFKIMLIPKIKPIYVELLLQIVRLFVYNKLYVSITLYICV